MKLTSEMVKAKAAELGIDCIAIGNIERFRGAPKLMSPLTYFPEARSVIAVAMRIPRGTYRGIEEGTQPSNVIFDICYKKDELGDPLINDHHAVALGAATYEELNEMYAMTAKINEVLKELFLKMNIKLVDFKIEFGKTSDGEIVLADEVSPDTCRLWDATTNEKLDKDRFRRDLGKVREAYEEILARLQKIVG